MSSPHTEVTPPWRTNAPPVVFDDSGVRIIAEHAGDDPDDPGDA